jgi:lipoate-protein ligase A
MEAVSVESIVTHVPSRISKMTGSCEEFHHREFPRGKDPVVSLFTPIRDAIVLGSTQEHSLLNEAACLSHDVEIVKRRSGGGLVLLSADSTLWVDVEIPSDHSLWLNDVGSSSLWLGQVFVEVLTALGQENLELHRGALMKSTWSSLICFAGKGPGEVFAADGSKIVGISQRRTRDWARFQCAVSLKWRPELLRELLHEPRPSLGEISGCGSNLTLDADSTATKVLAAIQEALN